MAKNLITRTITSTKVDVMCLDIEQVEPYNEVVILPRTYKDDRALLKAAADRINDETHKAVDVVRHEVVTELYGMTEDDFIANAKPLPPRKNYKNSNND